MARRCIGRGFNSHRTRAVDDPFHDLKELVKELQSRIKERDERIASLERTVKIYKQASDTDAKIIHQLAQNRDLE